ncbi:MAG: hypothetical protein KBS59_05220 [Clostridiales bacterium]|nr:hypothetical protein [Clostridiales bacterium]
MKKTLKIVIISVLALIIVAIVVKNVRFYYLTNVKMTEIDKSVSPDGKYSLVLMQVGEPEWPFGATHGALVLSEILDGGTEKIISKTNITIQDDGSILFPSRWAVSWEDDGAHVTLNGSEQEDEHIIIYTKK